MVVVHTCSADFDAAECDAANRVCVDTCGTTFVGGQATYVCIVLLVLPPPPRLRAAADEGLRGCALRFGESQVVEGCALCVGVCIILADCWLGGTSAPCLLGKTGVHAGGYRVLAKPHALFVCACVPCVGA